MTFSLGFQTRYILSPRCMLFYLTKVQLKVISILFKFHSACCVLSAKNTVLHRFLIYSLQLCSFENWIIVYWHFSRCDDRYKDAATSKPSSLIFTTTKSFLMRYFMTLYIIKGAYLGDKIKNGLFYNEDWTFFFAMIPALLQWLITEGATNYLMKLFYNEDQTLFCFRNVSYFVAIIDKRGRHKLCDEQIVLKSETLWNNKKGTFAFSHIFFH